jgi:ATP-dependent DNA helicase RecG
LFSELKIVVSINEYKKDEIRVLAFNIPSHETGKIVRSDGVAYYRVGSSLIKMDDDIQKRIWSEKPPDFSEEIQKGFSIDDIDKEAMENFKKLWSEKSGKDEYLNYSSKKILNALGLVNNRGIRKAAVILFGKKEKIDEFFPGSEVILEWRSNPSSTNYDFRQEWREPFFKIMEEIWKNINIRNSKISIQEGLTQKDIYIFSEKPIREAILNAVLAEITK